jgi:hypothetical protein
VLDVRDGVEAVRRRDDRRRGGRRSSLPWSCAARYHALVAVVGIFSQAFLLVPVAAATVVLVVRLGARLPNAAQ